MATQQYNLRAESLPIAERAYRLLKGLIVTGEIPPGEHLIEEQVAHKLNISRTPLREAVRKLEQEGLVERLPRGGVRAAPFSLTEVREVYSVRAVLEEFAVQEATRSGDPEHLNVLRFLVDEARQAREPWTIDAALEHGRKFHTQLCRASGNRFLVRILEETWDRIERYRRLTKGTRLYLAVEEHEAMLSLMTRGDAVAAGREAFRHVQNEAECVLGALQQYGGGLDGE